MKIHNVYKLPGFYYSVYVLSLNYFVQMKLRLSNNFSQNIYSLLRKSGYLPIHDRISGKDSFVRTFGKEHYPRFHLYLDETSSEIEFNLHLDQRKTRYEGQTAHGADYDSPEVKNELERVHGVFAGYQISREKSESSNSTTFSLKRKPKEKKKSWLKKIFG